VGDQLAQTTSVHAGPAAEAVGRAPWRGNGPAAIAVPHARGQSLVLRDMGRNTVP